MKKLLLVLICISALAVTACQREDTTPIKGAPGGPGAGVNVDREVTLLKSILKEDPENLQALIKLGNVTMDANRCQEALEAYVKALEIDPNNTNVRVDIGTCYRRTGRSDLAVEEYRKALELDPNHLYAHLNLGVVLAYDFNKGDEAIKEFEKYLELAPNSPNADSIRQEIAKLKAAK